MPRMKIRSIVLAFSVLLAPSVCAQVPVPAAPPTPIAGLAYDAELFPDADHDPAVPTPDSVLGFRLGDRPAMHAQIRAVCEAIDGASDRVRLFEYAVSHEGRSLFFLVIGSEANLARLDEIKSQSAALADPRTINNAEADRLIESMPAIAWMAYVIHGDEMSGSDAALAMIHHLAAARDAETTELLKNVLVIVDPLMNPDGRDRCITNVNQSRTAQPSVDDQSLIHLQPWPTGRMNHYLFDLNRDWIFCTQPETRGRVAAVTAWHPHYFMESHEMGPLDTFLFMPPRAPVNPNIPAHVRDWETAFAQDTARAFDAFGWRYYTGEWNEGWYPGYSGSWAAMRGIVDNLYEQATIVSDAVRRPEGTLETYRESVHKQLVASMSNLRTLSANRAKVLRDYVESRRRAVQADDRERLFVLRSPAGNDGRLIRLLDLLHLQGIEVFRAGAEFTASGRDWLGRSFENSAIPAGSLVVPSRQPLSGLASVLFETDSRMEKSFLTEERRELLRFGRSRLYDITGWNLAMFFGIEVSEVRAALPASVQRIDPSAWPGATAGTFEPGAVAHVIDGRDDRSVPVAARLMERGVKVRVLDKPSELDGDPVERGSLFITAKDNSAFKDDLGAALRETCAAFGVSFSAVRSGLGPGDAPDMGGEHFVLLEAPRVAVLSHEPFSAYSVGELWHLLDHDLGIRAAFIDTPQASGLDLRRYNVLVIPDGGTDGWSDLIPAIRSWVESGGTLIAVGNAAAALAKEKDGIGSTRVLGDVLTKLGDYRAAIVRDYLGKNVDVNPDEVWANVAPKSITFPWTMDNEDPPSEEEAKRQDEWRALFTPQGALVAARVDDRSWLTAGCGPVLPVLVGSGPVLIPKFGGNAPLLLGVFNDAPPEPAAKSPGPANEISVKNPAEAAAGKSDETKEKEPSPGWRTAPPGRELRLRMAGLLWPEAADRLAHSAYVTRERIGSGQVILFSESPNFRAATRGAARIFANAVVYGPGMGADAPIKP